MPSPIDIGGFLIDITFKATLLLCLTWICCRFNRNGAAATRHRLWGHAMVGLLCLPLLSSILPEWRIGLLPARVGSPLPEVIEGSTHLPQSSEDLRLPGNQAVSIPDVNSQDPIPDHKKVAAAPKLIVDHNEQSTIAESVGDPKTVSTSAHEQSPLVALNQAASAASASDRTYSIRETEFSMGSPEMWMAILSWVWFAGIVTSLVGMAVAHWSLRRFSRGCVPVTDPAVLEVYESVQRQQRCCLRVQLLIHTLAPVPLACGLFQRQIILPVSTLAWPKETLRVVLSHELAHHQRNDVAWQWLGRVACAVYWFHPLAWFALRHLRCERELACDDAVVLSGSRPSDYAEQLLTVARLCQREFGRLKFSMSLVIEMAQPSQLEHRVRALFDVTRCHGLLHPRVNLLLSVVTMVLTVIVATADPTSTNAVQPAADDELPSRTQNNNRTTPLAESLPTDLADDELYVPNVTGQVVFSDGRPAVGARVALWRRYMPHQNADDSPDERRSTDQVADLTHPIEKELATMLADENGRFAFRKVKAKIASDWQDEIHTDVVATFPGKAIAWYHAEGPSTVKLVLGTERVISGRVVDSDGRPIDGAEIRPAWLMSLRHITQADLEEGRWPSSFDRYFLAMLNPSAPPACVTDSNGEFTLTGLPKGLGVRLGIQAPQFAGMWFDTATVDKLEPELASKAKRPIATGSLTVSMTNRRYPFTLRVVDDLTGDLIPNTTLRRLTNSGGHGTPFVNVKETEPGLFQFVRLPPEITIEAAADIQQGFLACRQSVSPETQSQGEIRLRRGRRIIGRVVESESSVGIPNVRIRSSLDSIPAFRAQLPLISPSDKDGNVVALFPDGTFGLTIAREVLGYRIRVMKADQLEWISQNVAVEAGKATVPFEFRLPRTERIEGTVIDSNGKPVGGVTYRALFRLAQNHGRAPASRHDVYESTETGTTESDGRFSITRPFSQEYTINTLPIDVLFYDKRRHLVGQHLTDPRADQKPVQVVVKPASRLTGRVVDQTGRPLANALIEADVYGTGSGERMMHKSARNTRTGSDGRFEIRSGIPNRRIQVIADVRGFDRRGTIVRFSDNATDHDFGDIVLKKPMTTPILRAPIPDATGLQGLAAYQKLTNDYALFMEQLQEARKSPIGWPSVPNSSTHAFALALLQNNDKDRESNAIEDKAQTSELDFLTHLWIAGQHNVSNIGEREFVELRSLSSDRLIRFYADRRELGATSFNIIRYRALRGVPHRVHHETALHLLDANSDPTVRGISSYVAAESILLKGVLDGNSRFPEVETLADVIPHLERVVNEHPDIPHPWFGTTLGQLATGWLDTVRQLKAGKTPIELAWSDIDGKKVQFSEHHGKIVVVDFSSSGSGRALNESDYAKHLIQQAGPENVVVVTVASDDIEKLRQQREKDSDSAFIIGGHDAERLFRVWGVDSWPKAMIIGPDGTPRKQRFRGIEIADELSELLAKQRGGQ